MSEEYIIQKREKDGELLKCEKCGWVGTEEEQEKIESKFLKSMNVVGTVDVCPRCKHRYFLLWSKDKESAPHKLDKKGRCCGRKPISYKTSSGLRACPDPHYYCSRCNREFSPNGEQRENRSWALDDGRFYFRVASADQESCQLKK